MPSLNSVVALTRIGFASRGVMYLIIGYLALRSGRTEDGAGALRTLEGGSGALLLWVMALGFFAYGVWRLSEAAFDTGGHGSDAKGKAARAGGAISGLVHFGLGILAIKLALGSGGGGGDGARSGAAKALEWPFGEVALFVVAAGLLLTGAFQLIKAYKGDFLRDLAPKASRRPWVQWMGRAGYAARGVVFLVMAWFLFKAGLESDAGEAGGMGAALSAFPKTARQLVAFGLLLFGLFSLVEARFRRINDPRLIDRLKDAAA